MRQSSLAFLAALTAAAALGSFITGGASAMSIAVPQVAPQSQAITVADTQAVVTHSYAHLREKPDTSSKLLATLKKGTKLDVIEKVEGGKWAHVKTDKLEGYVATNLIK